MRSSLVCLRFRFSICRPAHSLTRSAFLGNAVVDAASVAGRLGYKGLLVRLAGQGGRGETLAKGALNRGTVRNKARVSTNVSLELPNDMLGQCRTMRPPSMM